MKDWPIGNVAASVGSIGLVRLKYPAIVRAYIRIAFASRLSNLLKVFDVDMASTVGDHSRALQLQRTFSDTGPPNAHHLSEKLLGQRQVVARQQLHPKQPFAGAGLHRVDSVAGGSLLDLCKEKLIVLN